MSHTIGEATVSDTACLAELIRDAFADPARRFGLTPDNCPTHPSNCQTAWVEKDFAKGCRYWILEDDGHPCGCVSLEQADPDLFYLKRLAVLPLRRWRGFGAALVRHALAEAARRNAGKVELSTIADDKKLQHWYSRLGFVYKDTARFEHLPFAVVHMTWTAERSPKS